MILSNDTICALATQPGGAIGVIRVSGSDCIEIVNKIFSKDIIEQPANTLHFGNILNHEGRVVDEVVLSIWRAPHSYTGENAIEISCHGSSYILQEVLHQLILAGCRQANPGEYTERAFLNGKMDLSQAEAVADLIASSNKVSYEVALSQLKGGISNELVSLREQLLKMTSLLELELDFSDHEELEFADRTELAALAQNIDDKVRTLANSFKTGQALKKGISVAIVGKTNVGKSTLLNQLLGEERAIVSDIEGTTRDIVEDVADIQGVSFRFIDTAGIRETTDTIEQMGIERSYKALRDAQIILWLIDERPTNEAIAEIHSFANDKPLVIVKNKCDLPYNFELEGMEHANIIEISAKFGKNIDQLKNLLYKLADIPEIKENSVIITNARHYDALCRAHEALKMVLEGLSSQLSGDLIAEDLKDVISTLGEITGSQINSQETLNNIFAHFCIGK